MNEQDFWDVHVRIISCIFGLAVTFTGSLVLLMTLLVQLLMKEHLSQYYIDGQLFNMKTCIWYKEIKLLVSAQDRTMGEAHCWKKPFASNTLVCFKVWLQSFFRRLRYILPSHACNSKFCIQFTLWPIHCALFSGITFVPLNCQCWRFQYKCAQKSWFDYAERIYKKHTQKACISDMFPQMGGHQMMVVLFCVIVGCCCWNRCY